MMQVWNARAEDLWGLRADEVRGKHFLNLDIRLPVDRLKGHVRESQAGRKPDQVVLQATNRRGKPVKVRVELTPLLPDAQDGDGSAREGTPAGCVVLIQEIPE
jgi:two-component system, chemotaxis family, CheB/CheR fusion protein